MRRGGLAVDRVAGVLENLHPHPGVTALRAQHGTRYGTPNREQQRQHDQQDDSE